MGAKETAHTCKDQDGAGKHTRPFLRRVNLAALGLRRTPSLSRCAASSWADRVPTADLLSQPDAAMCPPFGAEDSRINRCSRPDNRSRCQPPGAVAYSRNSAYDLHTGRSNHNTGSGRNRPQPRNLACTSTRSSRGRCRTSNRQCTWSRSKKKCCSWCKSRQLAVCSHSEDSRTLGMWTQEDEAAPARIP